jgi:hypothetical protein
LLAIVRAIWAELRREDTMVTAAEVRQARDSRVGRRPVGWGWVVLLDLVFVGMAVLLIYVTIALWPPTLVPAPATATPTEPTTKPILFGTEFPMTREQNLLLLVAVLGGLGAMAHVLRSFFKYVGERKLIWSWVSQYFLTPFLGALLATISYILLRAGLIGGAGTVEGNIWGWAGIATLVGLFSAQAMSKLKDIFETILTPPPAGTEHIDSFGGSPSPIDFTPKEGTVGAKVALTGSGFESATSVVFGGDIASDATWNASSGSLLTTVPAGAESGPLRVTITTDLVVSILTSEDSFKVLPT